MKAALYLSLAVALSSPAASLAQQLWALNGTVVTPSGPVDHATVLVAGTKIEAVGRQIPLTPGTRIVETNGVIYPGLIDLHDHVTWNALARWSAGQKSGARYDWQQLPEYQMALNVPHEKMVAEGQGCAAERYAEVKALVGGATSQAGLYPDDLTPAGTSVPAGCLAGLVRELGVSSRLYAAGTKEPLRYEVFPLALDPARTSALIGGLHDGSITSALFHIAEGSAENASARREFAMLKARGLLLPRVSMIHGVALTPANFAEMAAAHVGLIWSPHSNFELYGSTADVADAKKAGVQMAIAPDWSPTGSDGMLQELKYAAIWNATQSPAPFTDRELFDMATHNAAELGGIAAETGSIAPGMRADLLILSSPRNTAQEDPYALLVHASVTDVALVVVDGEPVYGDSLLMKKMVGSGASVSLDLCGTPKELAVPSPTMWTSTVTELKTALARWGASLSTFSECR
jgi:cytosine/adenosine deaminase-related metal-dependent hydrolase